MVLAVTHSQIRSKNQTLFPRPKTEKQKSLGRLAILKKDALTNQNARQEIKKRPKSNITLTANSDLWHKRIGHIGPRALY